MEQVDLSLSYGIHRSPSIGADGELSECVNLIPAKGELSPIIPPKSMNITLPTGSIVLYVHKTKKFTHYIYYYKGWLKYVNPDGSGAYIDTATREMPSSIASIGNTLMVVSGGPLEYIYWSENKYKVLGNKPPFADIAFGLNGSLSSPFEKYSLVNLTDKISDVRSFSDDNLDDINNTVKGDVVKFIQEQSVDKNRFMYPFFVRYAYKMYDGTTCMASAPILMIPNSGVVPIVPFYIKNVDDAGDKDSKALGYAVFAVTAALYYKTFSSKEDYASWKDIIKSVDIYVSAPIYTYDQSEEIKEATKFDTAGNWGIYSGTGSTTYSSGASAQNDYGKKYYQVSNWSCQKVNDDSTKLDQFKPTYRFKLPEKSIDMTAPENMLFYKISSITYEDFCARIAGGETKMEKVPMEDDVLKALQQRVELKDSEQYQTLDTFTPSYMYSFNSRLNMANVKRTLFNGYPLESMVCYNILAPYDQYIVKTYIHTDDRDVVVTSSTLNPLGNEFHFLYYPDSNAYRMEIIKRSDYTRAVVDLTPHDSLNGSYWYDMEGGLTFSQLSTYYEASEDNTIDLPNKIYTSKTSNPFYFPLGGINTVGTGEIIGIRSTSKPLSQGQYGDHQLYAFASDGIWGLRLSSDGLYSGIDYISGDICVNAASITQLDQSILFATERGLMLLQGSDTKVLSVAMDGPNLNESKFNVSSDYSSLFEVDTEPFVDTLRTAKLAYDYSQSLVYIFRDSRTKHYVYSLESGEFASVIGEPVVAIAQDYPAPVIQRGTNLYSLERYVSYDLRKGMAITRSMTFGDPFALKVLADLHTLGQRTSTKAKTNIAVFVSEDRENWSRLYSLRQRAFKFYRFVYLATLTDNDTISGTRLMIETRRNGKLR